MVEIGPRKVQYAGSNECRSLGGSQNPSGRLPKVSIGITVERCPKMGSGTTKEDGAVLPTWERVSLSQNNVLEENRGPGIAEASEGKRPAKDQKASACFSTRSVCHETPTTETVQVFANRASIIQSDDVVRKKFDTVAFRKRREKDGNGERVEKVAFTTMEEMRVPDKGSGREHPEGVNKSNNETLRMKLWEILTTASQNKQNMHSLSLENPPLDINLKRETQMDKSEKLKQTPNIIETDSESPNQTVRRPVTHSLASNKKVPSTTGHKLQGHVSSRKRSLFSSSSGSKLKLDGKNIFSFEEGERKEQSLEQTVRFKGKRSEQKKVRIQPRRIYFPRQLASDKSVQTHGKEQTLQSPDKASPQSKEKAHSPSVPGQGQKDILQTTAEVPDVNHHSQRAAHKHLACPSLTCYVEAHEYNGSSFVKRKTRSWEHSNSSPEPNDAYLRKRVGGPSAARNSNPLNDFQSPIFAMNASTRTHSPRTELPNEAFSSPVPVKNRMLTRKLYISNSLGNSRRISYGSDAKTATSDGTREIQESGTPHVGGKTQTEKQLSLSLVDDQDTEVSESDNFFRKGMTDELFSDAGSPKISQLTLHHRKRVCSKQIEKLYKINLSSPSPIGTYSTEENTGSHESSEEFLEDSLAGAVCQLALALERFKSKIKSHRVEKSFEILAAAAEKICLQLQNVESHIQADVGKLISTGNSHRKHLESRFQAQQGKLKFIHDKFKEEINQQLLDCRRTLEEFGEYQTELRGCADQQKASHRKLLLQVEEAMEAQLNDAEMSISAIHKEARKRMNRLKHALQELMVEGMIC
ncbi:meiosis-specific protein PAIR3 [Cocos nucifera]|uniref:Meiosis-specific protein PAIR3 n=1 Tax=Cocos nucifera TaxID=13894 RepID=A0A8K0MYZ7_COCNU|nr:meiosis-specific protein PAIR3 [Cocos nucifera]